MTIVIETDKGTVVPHSCIQFSGGERHVQLQEIAKQPKHLIMRAKLRSSNDIFDFMLLRNALAHAYGDVPVSVEIPYLPYARQDRVCAPGQAFSLQVFSSLFNEMRLWELVVWDIHSKDSWDVICPSDNVHPAQIIKSDKKLSALIESPDTFLICPDKGAVRRTNGIAEAFGNKRVIYCEKTRDPATGNITGTTVLGDIETDGGMTMRGKTLLITDDICDGGYTFIKLAEELRTYEPARIFLYVTHGIFSKGVGVFAGLIDEIFTTDSFYEDAEAVAAQQHAPINIIRYRHQF